jgi:hypothetical protein
MASLAGAVTTLGLLGVCASAPTFQSPSDSAEQPRPYTQSYTQLSLNGSVIVFHDSFVGKVTGEFPRPYSEDYTQLGLSATPVTPHTDFSGKTETILSAIDAADTWLVSWVEANVDQQEIFTADTWRVSWTEAASSSLHLTIPVSDNWTVNWSESVSLGISGVSLKTATETWSVSFTEAAAVGVVLDGTDTWTVDWGEAGVVETTVEAIAGTDDWTIDWDEGSFLNIFVGEVPRGGFDTWTVNWSESGSVTVPGRPQRITFEASYPKIWIRKL